MGVGSIDGPDVTSLIEELMIFALGFCAAGLLALACLPLVWKRAMRLTARRLRQLVPLSMDEIIAERDQLRAGFAIELRRVEQKLERAEAARNEGLVELGRRDAIVAGLEQDVARAEVRIAGLTGERDTVIRERDGIRGETGTAAIALHDLTGLAEQRREEILEAESRLRSLATTVDESRATIAALETRGLGLEAQVADITRALATTKAELGRTVEAVRRAVSERDAARAASEAAARERNALQTQIERQRGLSSEAERRLVEQDQAVAASKVTIEDLRAEIASLAGALAQHRDQRTRSAASDTDLAALRRAIRQVADDVLQIVEKSGGASVEVHTSAPDQSEAAVLPH